MSDNLGLTSSDIEIIFASMLLRKEETTVEEGLEALNRIQRRAYMEGYLDHKAGKLGRDFEA